MDAFFGQFATNINRTCTIRLTIRVTYHISNSCSSSSVEMYDYLFVIITPDNFTARNKNKCGLDDACLNLLEMI